MKTTKLIPGCVVALLMIHCLHAQLSVNNVVAPTSGCNGNVEITAAGTAGPFDLQAVLVGNTDPSVSSDSIQGTSTLSGLCAGDYEILAVNRFGCSHSLGIVSLGQSSGIIDKESDVSKSYEVSESDVLQDFKISYFPNPFAQDITLRIESFWDKTYNILITDIVGKKVYQQEVAVEAGLTDLVIKDLRFMPEGVYLVTVSDHEKDVIESFKIIKAR